jgi:hypothetical protein
LAQSICIHSSGQFGEVKSRSTFLSATAYSGFRFTCIGIFICDSGRESMLKPVLTNAGLSGMIFLEQEIVANANKNKRIDTGFKELNIYQK